MATFVVSHGAWAAGWAWKKMHPLMAAKGHRLYTPSHTGLGERSHLTGPNVDLELHITDIMNVIEYEDLRDVILIGHSYGGMVATGVADRMQDRVGTLVYVDAYAPRDGESIFDLVPERRKSMGEAARRDGDGWKMPPTPLAADTAPQDAPWANARRIAQPIKTFEQQLRLIHGEPPQPRHYIYCTRITAGDRFRPFLERARAEGWGAYELDAGHTPHVTAPEALMEILDRIARG
ncbi:MAG: alpha/beta fold hydrolase [Pseudomonadota bacterium]|nr:alpha/beta fold hydrolase [Pseudomonadota bacterium]